jgi:hypothetical protein
VHHRSETILKNTDEKSDPKNFRDNPNIRFEREERPNPMRARIVD